MTDTPDYRAPAIATDSYRSAAAGTLEGIWRTQPGFAGSLSSVDHKEIGIRYIVTAFAFLLLGGVEALVMRAQLARPNQQILSPETV